MTRYTRQKPLLLEVGRTYILRSGDEACLYKRHHEYLILINETAEHPFTFFTCSCGFHFPDHIPHELDLIREKP